MPELSCARILAAQFKPWSSRADRFELVARAINHNAGGVN